MGGHLQFDTPHSLWLWIIPWSHLQTSLFLQVDRITAPKD